MKKVHETVSTTVLYLLANILVALVATGFHLGDLASRLHYLDSTWYTHIAQTGYTPIPGNGNDGAVWAFFPAWPAVLHLLSRTFGPHVPTQLLGSVLSTVLFLTTITLVQRSRLRLASGFVPKTNLGLWFFLFSPGAWVFTTNHTEALFLLLSWCALSQHETVSDTVSSLLAGLAALTRNQGVLVAVCVAVAQATVAQNLRPKERLWRFGRSGVLSAAVFALWPLYQWWQTGNPMASMAAQENWPHTTNIKGYLDALIWVSDRNFHHVLVFWLVLAVGVALVRGSRAQRPLGLYCILSALLWPIQGINFPSAYRFSAVLFPVWFLTGDWTSAKLGALNISTSSARLARHATMGIAMLAMAAWALHTSWYYYSQTEWPY